MIDHLLLPAQRRLLLPISKSLKERGAHADAITLAGFMIGVMALPLLAFGYHHLAAIPIIINRLADGVDGTVARLGQPTDRGAFLDISLDFLFYAMVPLGFGLAAPTENALPAAVLICSFIGTGSSFLAFALIAERRGMSAPNFPRKGLYYLGGLTEGAETIAMFLAMCVWPDWFPVLAYGFAAACFLSTGVRLWQGWSAFKS